MEKQSLLRAAAEYINLDMPMIWQYYEKEIVSSYDPLWLTGMDLEKSLSYYGFDAAYADRVLQEAERIKVDSTLDLACYAMYYALFYSENVMHQTIWGWSAPRGAFLEHGSYIMCVVALLCGQKLHEQNMKRRNLMRRKSLPTKKGSCRSV